MDLKRKMGWFAMSTADPGMSQQDVDFVNHQRRIVRQKIQATNEQDNNDNGSND
jgi:hypothetical protein